MSVHLSVTFGGVGRGRETGRVDSKDGGNGEGNFTDGMPEWRYFSQATPGHPAG